MILNKKMAAFSKEWWYEEVVFTFPWWVVLVTLILPWLLWWKFVDRRRIKEISIIGFFIMITSYLLDQMGASLSLWTYKVTPTPLAREVFDPADLAILPVFYMLIYQYFSSWKNYIIAQIGLALFAAYIGGNLFQWLGIYLIINWKHIYSVPIYILLGLVAKLLVHGLNALEKSN